MMMCEVMQHSALITSNSVHFLVPCVPRQQPQDQVWTRQSVDTGNGITGKHYTKKDKLQENYW
jgi:hypothetical protein